VTTSKDDKRLKAEQLGMPVATAERHLRKDIIHELASQLGKNICCRCGSPIEDPDDFAIIHVQDWEEDSDLFWELTNIAFSHASCEASRSGKRQRKKQNMSKIEVRIEDPNGTPLAGVRHEGDLYIAGKRNSRYQIRVRNKTGKRILIVTTVDGRNVQTGKPGGDEDSGHVLEAYQTWVYKGWRTSSDEVAAFRFGKKRRAYSSQMGTPENVGVIGIAVFEEKELEPIIRTVREVVPMPYPYPYPVPVRPWRPWDDRPWRPLPYWEVTTTDTTFETPGSRRSFGSSGMTYSSTLSCGGEASSQFSVSVEPTSHVQQDAGVQHLGTEFGEQLSSSVSSTTFNRASDAPCEVWTIYYDSMEALRQKGIMVGRPSQRHKRAPQAFPKRPEWDGPYCQPPPRRRAYKP